MHLMHDALMQRKCQLHLSRCYPLSMEPGERLKVAREAAGYTSASQASEAMGIALATYIQHENGTRNFNSERAKRYARFMRVTPEWILYGRGQSQADPAVPDINELEKMLEETLSELLTTQTKIADLPRILAPALHEQLELFRADRVKPVPAS